MNALLRNHLMALWLLAPAAWVTATPAAAATAQPSAPEIRALEVTSDHGISPGSRLRFTLQGSPKAQASLRLRGIPEPIALKETSRGVYTGRYVIARADRIEEGDTIRATLKRGNRSTTTHYDVPANLNGNVAAAPKPLPAPLRIDRFTVTTQDRIEPGAELKMVLEGLPGSVAFVDLPGMDRNVLLRETRPGRYEASYTIRRSDNLNPAGPVVATLRTGDRVVTTTLPNLLAANPDQRVTR